jgi:regulator of sigma D
MQLEDYISAGRLNIYTDVLKLKPGEELGDPCCRRHQSLLGQASKTQ